MAQKCQTHFRTMTVIFQSDRKFSVFSYHASHGLLLLRSGRSIGIQTRCDVLFRDVRAMELRVNSDGLMIAEETMQYLLRFPSAPFDIVEEGLVAYRIGNEQWSGYVVGGSVQTIEDDREYFDPSALIATPLRDEV